MGWGGFLSHKRRQENHFSGWGPGLLFLPAVLLIWTSWCLKRTHEAQESRPAQRQKRFESGGFSANSNWEGDICLSGWDWIHPPILGRVRLADSGVWASAFATTEHSFRNQLILFLQHLKKYWFSLHWFTLYRSRSVSWCRKRIPPTATSVRKWVLHQDFLFRSMLPEIKSYKHAHSFHLAFTFPWVISNGHFELFLQKFSQWFLCVSLENSVLSFFGIGTPPESTQDSFDEIHFWIWKVIYRRPKPVVSLQTKSFHLEIGKNFCTQNFLETAFKASFLFLCFFCAFISRINVVYIQEWQMLLSSRCRSKQGSLFTANRIVGWMLSKIQVLQNELLLTST